MTVAERTKYATAKEAGIDLARVNQILWSLEDDFQAVKSGMDQWHDADAMLYCLRELRKAIGITE